MEVEVGGHSNNFLACKTFPYHLDIKQKFSVSEVKI